VVVLIVLIVSVTTGVCLWGWLRLSPTKTAELHYRGETMEFPLSSWSTVEVSEEGHARYLAYGSPNFHGPGEMFGEFEYLQQMGAEHYLRRGDLELLIVTRKRTRWFTEIRFYLRPRPSSSLPSSSLSSRSSSPRPGQRHDWTGTGPGLLRARCPWQSPRA
jgi:hypothetical protein